jgi:hypothetical protein
MAVISFDRFLRGRRDVPGARKIGHAYRGRVERLIGTLPYVERWLCGSRCVHRRRS